jgi:23S rRNA maturation-related 3'-5' exoribonuclease YhaM
MLFVGKVAGMNSSDGRINLLVTDKNKVQMNLKINDENGIVLGKVYAFEYDVIDKKERTSYIVKSFKEVSELPLTLMDETLRDFYKSSPISLEDSENEINRYIASIENEKIRKITEFLIFNYPHRPTRCSSLRSCGGAPDRQEQRLDRWC